MMGGDQSRCVFGLRMHCCFTKREDGKKERGGEMRSK